MLCVPAAVTATPVVNPPAKPPTTNAPPAKIVSVIPQQVFEAAGLEKLTRAEMTVLNDWLNAYVEQVFQNALRTGIEANPNLPDAGEPERVRPLGEVIESRIPGNFASWSASKGFTLENGQVWQLTSGGISGGRVVNPAVMIFPAGRGYRMKVEGLPGTIGVRRIR